MSRLVKPQSGRRHFLHNMVRAAGRLAVVGVTPGLQQQTVRVTGVRLRPPGALDEEALAGTYVRYGQCVQACPYDTLKLATLASGLTTDTPYFVARDTPCEVCEGTPCIKVCPSGALGREIKPIDDLCMGLAVLLDHEDCLNYQGLCCDVCYRECPKIDEAITLELDRNVCASKHARFISTMHSDACTGCGKCEEVCVLERPAIKALPLSLAKGELGHHYHFGWLEGNNGKS